MNTITTKTTATTSRIVKLDGTKEVKTWGRKQFSFELKTWFVSPTAKSDAYRHQRRESDTVFKATQVSMKEMVRLERLALRTVDRLKAAGIIDIDWDDSEFEIANYVYDKLIEWRDMDTIRKDIEWWHEQDKHKTDMKTTMLLLRTLVDTDDELDMQDQSSTRDHYFVDGKKECALDGSVYNERKIFMSQDKVTLKNDIYEIAYNNPDSEYEEIEDQVDIAAIKFAA